MDNCVTINGHQYVIDDNDQLVDFSRNHTRN